MFIDEFISRLNEIDKSLKSDQKVCPDSENIIITVDISSQKAILAMINRVYVLLLNKEAANCFKIISENCEEYPKEIKIEIRKPFIDFLELSETNYIENEIFDLYQENLSNKVKLSF